MITNGFLDKFEKNADAIMRDASEGVQSLVQYLSCRVLSDKCDSDKLKVIEDVSDLMDLYSMILSNAERLKNKLRE